MENSQPLVYMTTFQTLYFGDPEPEEMILLLSKQVKRFGSVSSLNRRYGADANPDCNRRALRKPNRNPRRHQEEGATFKLLSKLTNSEGQMTLSSIQSANSGLWRGQVLICIKVVGEKGLFTEHTVGELNGNQNRKKSSKVRPR